jgi:hypothetical protein
MDSVIPADSLGRSLALACPQRLVARVLELTGAAERLPLYGGAGEAAAG